MDWPHGAPTALEVAVGAPLGIDHSGPPLPEPIPGDTPRVALERSLIGALQQPPCVVMFSGGRDSSAMLALAVDLANRHGLELPVAYTSRHPGSSETEETEWQEVVIKRLDVADWVRRELTDELDWVGPYAQSDLLDHGLVWPPNNHFLSPALEIARSGTVVTGVFGDEMFSNEAWIARVRDVLERREHPTWRDVPRFVFAAAPRPIRAAVLNKRRSGYEWIPDWIPDQVYAEVRHVAALGDAEKSVLRMRDLAAWWAHRYRTLIDWSLGRLSEKWSAEIVNPFGEASFAIALARSERRLGITSREHAMSLLFGDLLPERTVRRSTKATFGSVGWNVHSARFLDEWDGEGLDPGLVAVEKLRHHWSRNLSPEAANAPWGFQSALLFQAAWLADQGVRTQVSPK